DPFFLTRGKEGLPTHLIPEPEDSLLAELAFFARGVEALRWPVIDKRGHMTVRALSAPKDVEELRGTGEPGKATSFDRVVIGADEFVAWRCCQHCPQTRAYDLQWRCQGGKDLRKTPRP